MRKAFLRIAGLLIIIGSLLSVAPARESAAQTMCGCTILCRVGLHCCADVVNGQCQQTCIPAGQTCPPIR